MLTALGLVLSLQFPPIPLPDADVDAPPGIVLVHDGYLLWMQPPKPGVSCCSDKDCFPVDARYDEKRKMWQAKIEGEWRDIPPEIILDPKKPENATPDGSSHACWDQNTKELLCFREPEAKI
jgi:hypothetical protein